MKRSSLIRHLHAQGCVLDREGKRHTIYCNPQNNKKAAVPRHTEIADLLARRICRDLGVSEP